MQEIPINEEQEKMKMNVMSIYIQDTALGTSLEPLEKRISFFLPLSSKTHNFSHSLKIIDQDEIADVAFDNLDIFIREGKGFFN